MPPYTNIVSTFDLYVWMLSGAALAVVTLLLLTVVKVCYQLELGLGRIVFFAGSAFFAGRGRKGVYPRFFDLEIKFLGGW